MKPLLASVLAIFAIGCPAVAQESKLPCKRMAYENRNQTDYGPLKMAIVRGTAKDTQDVTVPGVCIGIFTSVEHKLVMAT